MSIRVITLEQIVTYEIDHARIVLPPTHFPIIQILGKALYLHYDI